MVDRFPAPFRVAPPAPVRVAPRALALVLSLCAAGPLAAQEEAVEVYVPYTEFRLENGLTVLVHEDHSLPVASVNVWYHVGSANEKPGRTGFAHLFEHIMFEGSAHVAEGDFDNLLEAAGGVNNGSTSTDRTNYWENVPAPALELALWLEADRMGFLLETMDQTKLDLQRDVVKNERRQSYENRPYGLASETLLGMLYPPEHPYSWPVIGSMDDLSAATLEDVSDFFRTYYAPNNATLAVAGDVSRSRVRDLAEKYFGAIPAGPPLPEVVVPDPTLAAEAREVLEDAVRLPRLYMVWHAPAAFQEGEAPLEIAAEILGSGRNSRLQRRLVYEEELAQDLYAYAGRGKWGGTVRIVATARPGVSLSSLEAGIREELDRLAREGPTREEMERVMARIETRFVRSLERVGGFGGKANQLNEYHFYTGDPGFLRKDLARYRAVTPDQVRGAVGSHLVDAHAAVLSVVPRGEAQWAAQGPAVGGAP